MKLTKAKIISLISFLIIIIGGWLWYSHSKKPLELAPTITVTQGDISEQAEAVGYIKPRHFSTVKSQIGGTVAGIYHYEGEYVKNNQALIKVDPTPSPTDYASAYQDVAKSKVAVLAAEKDYLRLQDALKRGVISKNYMDYIQAEETYNTAKVVLELAQQKLALLKQGKTLIAGKEVENIVESPIDGYLLTRAVDIGDPVISISAAQSATALFTIADMKDLMFSGTVDERDAAKLKIGMPVAISIGSMPNKKITGILTKIALQSDKENTSQGVTSANASSDTPFNVGFSIEATRLQIPKDLLLRSGYSATAKINIQTLKKVLLLPERVVQFENDKSYVLLPKGGDKEPEKREITIGIADGINVEVISGVKADEKVLDQTIGNDDNGNGGPRMGKRR